MNILSKHSSTKLVLFTLFWTITSAQLRINIQSLIQSALGGQNFPTSREGLFARLLNVRIPVLPSSCASITQYRTDCTRRCRDINLPIAYCPPGTRRLACHECSFPRPYTAQQGGCVNAAECAIENLFLKPSLATLPPTTRPTTASTTTTTTPPTTTTTTTTTPPPTTTTATTTSTQNPSNIALASNISTSQNVSSNVTAIQSLIPNAVVEVVTITNDPRCSQNRIYTTCATCDFSCGRRFEPRICGFPTCRSGCACRPNHFVSEQTGNCVPAELCPPRPRGSGNVVSSLTLPGFAPPSINAEPNDSITSTECSGDLIRTNCVLCDRTCLDKNPKCASYSTCVPGCTCPERFYRDGEKCVTKRECPRPRLRIGGNLCGLIRCPSGHSCRNRFLGQCVPS